MLILDAKDKLVAGYVHKSSILINTTYCVTNQLQVLCDKGFERTVCTV